MEIKWMDANYYVWLRKNETEVHRRFKIDSIVSEFAKIFALRVCTDEPFMTNGRNLEFLQWKVIYIFRFRIWGFKL